MRSLTGSWSYADPRHTGRALPGRPGWRQDQPSRAVSRRVYKPMSVRRPRTAAQSTALPSLAALLASGVALDGCDTPAQTAGRMQRLTEHGEQAGRELDRSQHGRAATEVAIGLGLLPAPVETRIQSPGEAPVVQTEPPVVQTEPPVVSAGMQVPVEPTPPSPSSVDVDGGVREVRPTPPTPPRVHTPPRPQPHRVPVRGGAPAVRPGPGDSDGF